MSSTYYIDGYNVLYQSSVLRPLAVKDFEAARDALIEKVAGFCVALNAHAVIVFDGRGEQRHPERAVPKTLVKGLEILYSPADLSADAVIERMIYKAGNRLDFVVVSNDRSLRDLCRNLGALTMEADNFLESVRETRAGTSQVLKNLEKASAPAHLEDRLDSKTLDQLRKLREQL